MAVDISALPSANRSMHGEGLNLAGEGLEGGRFKVGKFLKKASKFADVAAPALMLAQPELAPAIGTAMAAKKILDGSGLRGGKFGKGTIKKVKRGAIRAAKVGEKLVDEFGTESQKKKAAKARKVAEIVGSGHGGQDLRKKVMQHHYG